MYTHRLYTCIINTNAAYMAVGANPLRSPGKKHAADMLSCSKGVVSQQWGSPEFCD